MDLLIYEIKTIRSKLAHNIKSFGVMEENKSSCDKASLEDLKRHLQKIGEKREYFRRAVTISASLLTRKDM